MAMQVALGGGACLAGTATAGCVYMRWIWKQITSKEANPKLIINVGKVAKSQGTQQQFLTKGCDNTRSGASAYVATRDLKEPAWIFNADKVSDSSTVVDEDGNIYLSTFCGLLFSVTSEGELRWQFEMKGMAPPCPVISNATLYTSCGNGYAYALDCATGKPTWEKKVAPGGGGDSWAWTAAGGLVITCHNDDIGTGTGLITPSFLLALNPATGEEVWRFSVPAVLYNVEPSVSGDRIFFGDADGGLYGLVLSTGKEVWSVPVIADWDLKKNEKTMPHCLSGASVYYDGLILSGASPSVKGGCARAHQAEDGKEVWRVDFDQHLGNSLAAAEIKGVPTMVLGVGYTAPGGKLLKQGPPPYTGYVVGLHCRTGEQLWRFDSPHTMFRKWTPAGCDIFFTTKPRLNLCDSFNKPAIGADGTVYIGWQNGHIYAIDGSSGELCSSYETKEGMQASFNITKTGDLLIQSGETLYCWRK